MTEPLWLAIARAEAGVRVQPVGSSHPRITEYHRGTNIEGWDDKVSWCSPFVNWCLGRAGIDGTNSAVARSWLRWGEPVEVPTTGCVAVLWREAPSSWKGHVGFYLRQDAHRVWLFGGNQLGAVREHAYARDSVLAYRWPASVPMPTSNGADARIP